MCLYLLCCKESFLTNRLRTFLEREDILTSPDNFRGLFEALDSILRVRLGIGLG